MSEHDDYLIWSHKNTGWWRPGSEGYTKRISEAGHYTLQEALAIYLKSIPGTAIKIGALPNLPVLANHIADMQRIHHAQYPGDAEPWE